MRIAYLITRSDAVGGAHIHVRDLALAVRRKGHDVVVLHGGEGDFTAELKAHDIPYIPLRHLRRELGLKADLRALREIRSVLRQERVDVLSTHSSKAGTLGRIAARTMRLPVIFTAHGWAFTDGVNPRQAALYRWVEKMTGNLAYKIITVSEYDRELALRYQIASPKQIVAIHNGMPDIPRELYANPESAPPKLVMVARFEEQKDHDTLVRALAKVSELEWSLDFIGDGPRRSVIEALVDELGLAERIHFLGTRRDVAERLAESQVFLLISHWEGFPRSILEAMRAGLPVVASDVGGSRESVVDGTTGFLIPRQDVDLLAERLRHLILDRETRGRFGAEGRVRYADRFTFERMLSETFRIYEEAVNESKR